MMQHTEGRADSSTADSGSMINRPDLQEMRAGHVLEHGRFILIEKVGGQFDCPHKSLKLVDEPEPEGSCKAKEVRKQLDGIHAVTSTSTDVNTGIHTAVPEGPLSGSVERIFSRRGIRLPYTDALMQLQGQLTKLSSTGQQRLLLDGPREQFLPAIRSCDPDTGVCESLGGSERAVDESRGSSFYDFFLGKQRIGRGSFGECWRALEISSSGEYREVVLKKLLTKKTGRPPINEEPKTENDSGHHAGTSSSGNGHATNEGADSNDRSSVLENKIRQSGQREIFFGVKLRHTPHVARYVDNFSRGDDMWLVFVNEGYSLLHLLWWLPPNGGATPEPSPFWWSLKRPMTHPPALARTKIHKNNESDETDIASTSTGLIKYTAQQIAAGSHFIWSSIVGELLSVGLPPPATITEGPESIEEEDVAASKAIAPAAYNYNRATQVLDGETPSSNDAATAAPRSELMLPSPYSYYNTVPANLVAIHYEGEHRPINAVEGLQVVKSLMYQLLRGLAGIHSQNITHRDIKLGNLLVRESRVRDQPHQSPEQEDSSFRDTAATLANLHLRIADFGSAVFLNAKSGQVSGQEFRDNPHDSLEEDEDSPTIMDEEQAFTSEFGDERKKSYQTRKKLFGESGPSGDEETMNYLPPEAFFDPDATFYREPSFDIFSVGVCLLEIITGRSVEQIVRIRDFETQLQTDDTILQHSLHKGRAKHDATTPLDSANGEPVTSQFVQQQPAYQGGQEPDHDSSNQSVQEDAEEQTGRKRSGSSHPFFRSPQEEEMISARKILRLEMKYTKAGYSDIEIANALHAQAFVDTCIRPLSMDACTDVDFQRLLTSLDYAQQGFDDPLGRDLLRKMLAWNPEQRITAKLALRHPWFHSEVKRKKRTNASVDSSNERDEASRTTTIPKSFATTGSSAGHGDSNIPHSFVPQPASDDRMPTEDQSSSELYKADESPQQKSSSIKPTAYPDVIALADIEGREADMEGTANSNKASDAAVGNIIGSADEEDERGSSSYPAAQQENRLPRILTGAYQVKGRRPYMEDAYYVKRKRRFDLLGVFDGHYGAEVARSLRDTFYTKFLKKAIPEKGSTSISTSETGYNTSSTLETGYMNKDGYMNHDSADPTLVAVRRAILDFDKHIRETQTTDAGSTMTLVILQHMKLRIAQIGDCEVHLAQLTDVSENGYNTGERLTDAARDKGSDLLTIGQKVEVISTGELGKVEDIRENPSARRKLYLVDMQERSGRDSLKKTKFFQRKQLKARVPELSVKPLVTAHSPQLSGERDRIMNIPGGFIGEQKRVQDKLATSRSVGRLPSGLKPYISSEPDLFLYNLDPNADSFLIIGSDGLFDILSSRESAEIVHAVLRGGGEEADLQEAARILVEAAIEKGSTDNISVVIAKFLWTKEK